MSQVRVTNGDLYIIFKEIKDDVCISYHLDNGAEFDFIGDELAQLILPNFEAQVRRGSLDEVPIDLVDTHFKDKKMILSIAIFNDTINITIDCSSIMHKL